MNQSQGIYDARQLGTPKMFVLGAQHMFAMFGATVLVPYPPPCCSRGWARCCSTF